MVLCLGHRTGVWSEAWLLVLSGRRRSRRAPRGRGVGYRVCLALFAAFWLTIGFGMIDLASGLAAGSTDGNDVLSTGVLSAAYGAIAAIVLPAGFLSQLRAASRRVAALQQVVAATFAFALAGVLALDPLSFISVATLAVMLAILWRLSPERPPMWRPRVASIRCSR